MIAVVLSGLAERRLRTALTAVAILLGVAMVAGTYVQTDQIRNAFTDIEQEANRGVDVDITRKTAFSSSFGGAPEPLPESLVRRVAAVDGVARAEGQLFDAGNLVIDGDVVEPRYAPSMVLSRLHPPFDPLQLVRGRFPQRPGEVVVNRAVVDEHDLRVGDRLGVGTRSGTHRARLVGVVDYGSVASLGGAVLVYGSLPDVQRWHGRRGEVSEITAAAADGVSQEELARRIETALDDPQLDITTGADAARQSADEAGDAIGGFLTPALLAFAGVAVVVGAFVIFNTFSITVAQRTREFALLRALGATRRQVLGAVAAEALLLGAVASVLGLIAGVGFARGLNELFDAAGFGMPHGPLEVAPRTVVVSLAVGMSVTLLAALVPARRATRVPPVAALEGELPVEATSRRRWPRRVAGVALLLGGLATVMAGLTSDAPATSRLALMGSGSMALFAAGAMGARFAVRPLVRVLGWPLQRAGDVAGELAEENAARDTRRTAVTTASLVVGMALVVFVAVLGSGLKASVSGQVGELFANADLVVSSDSVTPVPSGVVDAVDAVPGTVAVSSQLFDQVQIDGRPVNLTTDVLNGVDPATFAQVYSPKWVSAQRPSLASLRGDASIVEEQFAKAHDLAVGDRFRAMATTGRQVELRVAGVYRDPQILQGFVVDRRTSGRITANQDPYAVFVRATDTADVAALQATVRRALDGFPTAQVRTRDEYVDWVEGQVDQIVALLYALLAMSVVISVFGIANSLFLSVHERTRELGLLRAIGATREQVRRLVRWESVLVAVIGGLLGTAIGVVLAWLTTEALGDWGLVFELPAVQVAVCLVLAAVVGVLAAVAPARRAARLDVLRAVART